MHIDSVPARVSSCGRGRWVPCYPGGPFFSLSAHPQRYPLGCGRRAGSGGCECLLAGKDPCCNTDPHPNLDTSRRALCTAHGLRGDRRCCPEGPSGQSNTTSAAGSALDPAGRTSGRQTEWPTSTSDWLPGRPLEASAHATADDGSPDSSSRPGAAPSVRPGLFPGSCLYCT